MTDLAAVALAVQPYPVATLQATAERAESYAAGSRSPNTRRAYASAWRSFSRWCERHGLAALPAEPGTVALYLTDLSDMGRKVSTVGLHATVIGQAHREAMAPDPTTHPRVKALLSGIRRVKGVVPVRKRPILADDLREMLAHVPAGIRGVRDRALLLVAFYSACRRSELSALRVEHAAVDERGATIAIARSKTDQEGRGRHVALPFRPGRYCPVGALQAWLEAAGIGEGPVFRRVDRWGVVHGGALSGDSIASVVKEYAAAAGLDPRKVAGHSMRAGFVTQAILAGASEGDVSRQTGHASTEMISRVYTRPLRAFDANAVTRIDLSEE